VEYVHEDFVILPALVTFVDPAKLVRNVNEDNRIRDGRVCRLAWIDLEPNQIAQLGFRDGFPVRLLPKRKVSMMGPNAFEKDLPILFPGSRRVQYLGIVRMSVDATFVWRPS
jgi:hypothetical protein